MRKDRRKFPRSAEVRGKISLALIGHTPWNKGLSTKTDERVRKNIEAMSISLKGRHCCPRTEFKKGIIPWNKGKEFLQIRGEKHHAWRGGIGRKTYPSGWTKRWKEKIRNFYKNKCYLCGKEYFKTNRKLSIHHIDYNKKNIDPTNLIPLCVSCHIKTNKNRVIWEQKFIVEQMCDPF